MPAIESSVLFPSQLPTAYSPEVLGVFVLHGYIGDGKCSLCPLVGGPIIEFVR